MKLNWQEPLQIEVILDKVAWETARGKHIY